MDSQRSYERHLQYNVNADYTPKSLRRDTYVCMVSNVSQESPSTHINNSYIIPNPTQIVRSVPKIIPPRNNEDGF